MTVDLRCYLVTTGAGQDTVDLAATVAGAGAGIIQVREKSLTTRELLAFAIRIAEAVRAANPTTRVVVDDRADVAFAAMRAGAHVHGVHLGADDLPVGDARAMLGPEAIIGLTTGTLELVEAANAHAGVIDYVGAGPFRPTPTKDSGRPPLGVAGYPPLVAVSRVPVVAIGDVTPADVPALAATGIAGVAVVRALAEAEDPAAVVRAIIGGFPG